jgi:hypothetical protein
MKKLVFIFFISVYAFESQSQYIKPYYREDEKEMKEKSVKKNKIFLEALKRNLLVVLEEEDPKRIRELQKSEGKLAEYRRLINLNNKLLRDLVPKFWRQDSAIIEFKKYSECMALSKAGSKAYYTIEFSSLKDKEDFDPAILEKDPLIKRNQLLRKTGEFGKFVSIQMINNFFLSKYYEPTLSKGGYENFVMERHASLQNKTLLVDSAQVDFTRSFNMKDLKDNYPYNLRLAGATEILKEVKAQNGVYAYLTIIPNTSQTGKDNSFNNTAGGGMTENVKEQVTSYTHYIVDCAGSEPMFIAKNQPRLLEKTGWQLNTTYILKLYNFNVVR